MNEVLSTLPMLLAARPSGELEVELDHVALRDAGGELVLTLDGKVRVKWNTDAPWPAEPKPEPTTPPADVIDVSVPTPAAAAKPDPSPAAETDATPAPATKKAAKSRGDRHPAE